MEYRQGRKNLDRARSMRREMTPAEARLWVALRRRGSGFKFRRQEPIGPFIVDFACVRGRLIVEVDGASHSLGQYDENRDAYLRRLGWRTLRFSNEEVRDNRRGVLIAIEEALSDGPSSYCGA